MANKYAQFISQFARQSGADPATIQAILAIARHESGLSQRIAESVKPGWPAQGLFQFIPSTWQRTLAQHGGKFGYGPSTRRTNWQANARMGVLHILDNAQKLQSMGAPVNFATLRWMHFLPALAPQFLSAMRSNPGMSLVGVLQASGMSPQRIQSIVGHNKGLFYAKGRPATVADWMRRHGGKLPEIPAGAAGSKAEPKGLAAILPALSAALPQQRTPTISPQESMIRSLFVGPDDGAQKIAQSMLGIQKGFV